MNDIPFGVTLFTFIDWTQVLDTSREFIMQLSGIVSMEIFQILDSGISILWQVAPRGSCFHSSSVPFPIYS